MVKNPDFSARQQGRYVTLAWGGFSEHVQNTISDSERTREEFFGGSRDQTKRV